MLTQPLLDKLIQLRLPAFHNGLQEQLANPKYAELSFEERLALLVDLECTRRHDQRIQRSISWQPFLNPPPWKAWICLPRAAWNAALC